MKILVLMNGWAERIITGGDLHILKTAKIWSKYHRISFIVPKMGYDAANDLLNANYRIYLSSYENNTSGLFMLSWKYFKRILRTIMIKADGSHDVVISSSHLLYDVLPAIFIKRRNQSKWVVYVHLLLSEFKSNRRGFWGKVSILNEKITLNLCKKADLVFAVSDSTRQQLIDVGYNADRLFVVGNGLDHEAINGVHAAGKKYEACFCGRLTKRKGIYDLIDIWESLTRDHPAYKLIVIGNGSERINMQRIIEQKGLQNNIIIAGFLPENDKILSMKSSILFLYPTYEDTWGIVVTEAMACGLPVVCYNLAAFEIFKDYVVMVPAGDKQKMRARVIELLGDEIKRHQFSLIAKDFAKSLDWSEIASKEITKINDLLA